MPCPFLQSTTTNDVDNHQENDAEPLNYTKYLGIGLLLSSLRCLSHTDRADTNSPPVHGEHFFILIHQGNLRQTFRIN
jgi:hypothetical protein